MVKNEFMKVGDLVKHKESGEKMTVVRLIGDDHDADATGNYFKTMDRRFEIQGYVFGDPTCIWFDKTELKQAVFKTADLEIIKNEIPVAAAVSTALLADSDNDLDDLNLDDLNLDDLDLGDVADLDLDLDDLDLNLDDLDMNLDDLNLDDLDLDEDLQMDLDLGLDDLDLNLDDLGIDEMNIDLKELETASVSDPLDVDLDLDLDLDLDF